MNNIELILSLAITILFIALYFSYKWLKIRNKKEDDVLEEALKEALKSFIEIGDEPEQAIKAVVKGFNFLKIPDDVLEEKVRKIYELIKEDIKNE